MAGTVHAEGSITRRGFLAATGLAATASLIPRSAGGQVDPRPNILWITTEDISPDLACYGDPYAITPNLDQFASEGALFLNAFSHSGVCAPTRSGIITGMYPTTIGTHHMRSRAVPPPYVKCFTEYLRAAGYYCSNNSKTDYNFDSPLTAWDECGPTASYFDCPPGQPFFAVFNMGLTHEGRVRQPDESFHEVTSVLEPYERHDPAKANIPPYYPDTPVVRRDWSRYADLITVMDKAFGAWINRVVEEQGLGDNTIIFFYGDHGRGLPRAKRWIYDSGIRVPLIVRWPGTIKPGTVREDFVRFIDLAPTLLSIAGVEPPPHMQGRVFLGDNVGPEPEYIFAARDRMDETYDIIRCVRDRRYKYIRNFEPEKPYAQHIRYMDQTPTMQEMRRLNAEGALEGAEKLFFRQTKPIEELYDIVDDPHEIRSLAADPEYADVLVRMRAALERWMEETGDLGLVPEDQLKERMRPNGMWSVTDRPLISPPGGSFSGPPTVSITCPTEGVSIAYTFEEGKDGHWNLYTESITIAETSTLRVRACRLGFKDSPIVTARFEIGDT